VRLLTCRIARARAWERSTRAGSAGIESTARSRSGGSRESGRARTPNIGVAMMFCHASHLQDLPDLRFDAETLPSARR
jgi:hypothetical protein